MAHVQETKAGTTRNLLLFAAVGMLFVLTGVFQSWNLSL
jgi:hypothetical protein